MKLLSAKSKQMGLKGCPSTRDLHPKVTFKLLEKASFSMKNMKKPPIFQRFTEIYLDLFKIQSDQVSRQFIELYFIFFPLFPTCQSSFQLLI
jgi:hypothetical protein